MSQITHARGTRYTIYTISNTAKITKMTHAIRQERIEELCS